MKQLSRTFLKGLAAVVPIAVTAYLLYWIGNTAETVLGAVLQALLPDILYVPGMGLVAGFALIFVIGVLLNAYLVRRLWDWGESLFHRIPLVKTIYGAAQDLMAFFSQTDQREMDQVVLVPVGNEGYRIIGFVTREDCSDLPDGLNRPDTVAVYLPMSYQIGGYTVFLPRSVLEPVDMPVDRAMRLAVTAGLSGAE